MRKIPYTYSIVKYLHDASAGETLNIGVVMCAPSLSFIDARFTIHYERLSKTFANFGGDHYRDTITDLQFSIERLRGTNIAPTLFVMDSEHNTVEDVIRKLAPDRGLSIQFGPVLAGLADNPEAELDRIYQDVVISQSPKQLYFRRDDEEVWRTFRRPLSDRQVDKVLKPKSLKSPEGFEYTFQHAFKNENWHVLKPVALDYAQASGIQDKATKVLGEAIALQGSTELSTYYLLLGQPRFSSHKGAYVKAKNLLNKIPVKKEIFEESEAEQLADYLASYVAEHGVQPREV